MSTIKPRRVGRPAKAVITREAAARAALEIVDDLGLERFTVEHVAKKMGVRASALFHHFGDRDGLLEHAAALILAELRIEHGDVSTWAERQIRISVATRRAILRYPKAAPLLLRFYPRQLFLANYDQVVADCPIPPERQMAWIEGNERFVFGSSLYEAQAMVRGVSPTPQFDAAALPHLARAMQCNPLDSEGLFVEALWCLYAGFGIARP